LQLVKTLSDGIHTWAMSKDGKLYVKLKAFLQQNTTLHGSEVRKDFNYLCPSSSSEIVIFCLFNYSSLSLLSSHRHPLTIAYPYSSSPHPLTLRSIIASIKMSVTTF
jgi:hypothetical protein